MLKEINIKDMNFNPFSLIGDEWMLIAAGDEKKHNMMTASWGGVGVIWNKNVSTIYIRPTRYTLDFVEKQDYYTLNFFGSNKEPHKVGGSKSGRDIDKAKAADLTPIFADDTVYYEEAELVLICKKLYYSELYNKNFLAPEIEGFYAQKDYHKVFIGEIIKVLKK